MVHVVNRSARRFVAGVVVVGLLVGVSGIRTASARAPLGTLGPTRFVVVPPCRLLDTRPANALDAGQEVELDVAGECGVPAAAVAAALTVTVTATGDAGHATVYPADVARPEASTTNWDRSGQTRANTALVRLSDDGAVRIWMAAATDLVVDVAGAFVPATTSPRWSLRPDRTSEGRRHPLVGHTAAGRHHHRRVARGGRSGRARPGGEHHPHRDDRVRLRRRLPGGIGCSADIGAECRRSRPDAGRRSRRPCLVRRHHDRRRVRQRRHRRRRRILHRAVGGELERRAVRARDADASARHALGGATALRPGSAARSTWWERLADPSPRWSPTGR